MPFDAACAVRTFALPDTLMPIKPHAQDKTAPTRNPITVTNSRSGKKNDNDKQNKPDNTDYPILPGEICRSSLLNGMGNFLYAFITLDPRKESSYA